MRLKSTLDNGQQRDFTRDILRLDQLYDRIEERLSAILGTLKICGMISKPVELTINVRMLDTRERVEGKKPIPERVVLRASRGFLLPCSLTLH